MKYIAVFCSAQEIDEKYVKPAEEFARLLTKHGYHLVWGGTDKGLMKTIASAVAVGGGKLVGVSIARYQAFARKNVDEMIIAKTLGERKATMLERSSAIVMMAGGIGTLDEITEILELKKQGNHNKPIVVLNTDNFYKGLRSQLEKMKDEGFIPNNLAELIYFADSPEDAIVYIHDRLK